MYIGDIRIWATYEKKVLLILNSLQLDSLIQTRELTNQRLRSMHVIVIKSNSIGLNDANAMVSFATESH